MISRKTALALAEAVCATFSESYEDRSLASYGDRSKYRITSDALYDFLYENSYPAWFCNIARQASNYASKYSAAVRPLKDFVMQLHTGESITSATQKWTWEQRASYGQEQLQAMAEDLLNDPRLHKNWRAQLISALELDGYVFRSNRLLVPETEVLDTTEQAGVLEGLYAELALDDRDTTFHHLSLSETHYIAQKWDDSISNSRKFLESVLRHTAAAHAVTTTGSTLPSSVLDSPARVRDYLEQNGLIDRKEKEVLASVYGLLSETGGHPYMAQNDQARLLRHLALTLSQFVMLRLQSALSPRPTPPR